MKPIYLIIISLVFSICGWAQEKSAIIWGENFRLHKGTTDLKTILTDPTGAYLQESHVVQTYGGFGAFGGAATLIKVNTDLTEVYRHSFNKELRGKKFIQFFSCGDNLFIFSSDYNKDEKQLGVFGAKVDKSSGKLLGDWKQLTSLPQDSKKDLVNFKFAYNSDSTKVVVVSSVEGNKQDEYKVQEFDSNLKATSKAITISNEFEPKKNQLEDLIYTFNRKVILVARIYEYKEGKKKQEESLEFNHYTIRVYNDKGKQESELSTNINGKWLSSTKVLQERNENLVLAAFYSNEKMGSVNGLIVQKFDITTGKLISAYDKRINSSIISTVPDNSAEGDDKDETKEDKVARQDMASVKKGGEGLSKYMQFRNVFYTSDSGLIILAEAYRHYLHTSRSYTAGVNNSPGTWRTDTYAVFESGDLMICKIDAKGDVSWLQVIPKNQYETYRLGSERNQISSSFTAVVDPNSFFYALNMPFYSGFGAMKLGNAIRIILNDNPKNGAVTQANQQAKTADRLRKSDCFMLNVDEATGKCSRKKLFSNAEGPTAMPRLGSVIGSNMYLVGRTDRLMGKTKMAVAKISFQ